MAKKSLKSYAIGALVAVVGSVACLGTTFALYKVTPEDQTMHIGAHTSDDVILQVGPFAWTDGSAIAPQKDISFSFTAGYDIPENSNYRQPYYLVEMDMTIASSNADFINALKNTGTYVQADADGTVYTGYWKNNSKFDFSNATVETDEALTTITTVNHIILAADTDINISGALSLGDIEDSAFVAFNGKDTTFSVNIDFKAPTTYGRRYLVGGFNNWQTEDDKFMMVPNPKGENFEWMFVSSANEGDPNYIASDTEFKGYIVESGVGSWTPDPNFYFNGTPGATFYWDGTTNSQIKY